MPASDLLTAEFSKTECIGWVLATQVLFFLINNASGYILPRCSNYLATSKNFWRFKNTFVSWIHSILASTLVCISIYATPAIFDDMINAKTKFAYITISFSAGYFIYDAIDIIKANKKINSAALEVLLHHFIILGIFWVPLFTNQFVGYTLAALSIEFNTVFLHLRFMFVFFNVEKSSASYRLVSILNIASFVLFRILTLCWMTRWIVLNRSRVHIGWFTLGSVGLAAMMIINILLLKRLLQADFTNKDRKSFNTKNCSDAVTNNKDDGSSEKIH